MAWPRPTLGGVPQKPPKEYIAMLSWKRSLALLAAIAAILPLGRAHAQLAAVGPLSPDNGFPVWYKDGQGLSLDLCLKNTGFCLLDAPVNLTNPNQPFPQNYGGTFPVEAFWWAG